MERRSGVADSLQISSDEVPVSVPEREGRTAFGSLLEEVRETFFWLAYGLPIP